MIVVTELVSVITAAIIAADTVLTCDLTATIVPVALIYVCNNDTTMLLKHNNVSQTQQYQYHISNKDTTLN